MANGQNTLGILYARGQGVAVDHVEAVRWFRKAAEQGYATAQHNLGSAYFRGRGVPADDAEALKWFRKAAAQGHAASQHNLGFAYFTGKGVPADNGEAARKLVPPGRRTGPGAGAIQSGPFVRPGITACPRTICGHSSGPAWPQKQGYFRPPELRDAARNAGFRPRTLARAEDLIEEAQSGNESGRAAEI